MFRIYRYFAVASAGVMLVAMLILGFGFQHHEINNLVAVAENSNVVLAKTLSNIIITRFKQRSESKGGTDLGSLQPLLETSQIAWFLHAATANSGILKIKIYGLDGTIFYSSDPADIGFNRISEPHDSVFFAAAEDGVAGSQISFKDRISAFSGELFNRDVVETYVSIEDRPGSIIGVFEIYADVTDLKDRIDDFLPLALLSLFAVFLLIYSILVLIVMRRAMAPLRLASKRAMAIGPRTSGARLPTEGMAAEVAPLIEAINGALERLDAALEAQRQFTADAAHELLTPLAVLKANLHTLDDETVADLRQDVTAMSEIVQQLLELAELDSLDPETDEIVNVREVCVEVAAMMAPVAHKEKKYIEFTHDDADIQVHCCARSLARALQNLVANAITAAPPETAIEISLQSDGAIRVVDHGPGVPLDKRDTIFQRFWRGTRGDRPGAGLGLSIVKRFVDTYGGTIEVDDAPGGGGVFTIRLPLAR